MQVEMFPLFLLCWLAVTRVGAVPGYQNRLPNGNFTGVFLSNSFGHFAPIASQNFVGLNQFALDFQENDNIWTIAFCERDSDGDGFSNGAELGDPDCIFETGVEALAIGSIKSNPADPNSIPNGDLVGLSSVRAKTTDRAVLIAHSVVMGTCFGIFIPLGIVIVMTQRMHLYVKADPGSHHTTHVTTVGPWFNQHRSLMAVGVVFSTLEVVITGVMGPGFGVIKESLHAKLGVAVVSGAMVTFLLGLCLRPKFDVTQDAEKPSVRKAWEVFHFTLGRSTSVLSMVALATGLHIGYTDLTNQFLAIIIVVFAIYIIGAILAVWVAHSNWRRIRRLHKNHDLLMDVDGSRQEQGLIGKSKSFYEMANSDHRKVHKHFNKLVNDQHKRSKTKGEKKGHRSEEEEKEEEEGEDDTPEPVIVSHRHDSPSKSEKEKPGVDLMPNFRTQSTGFEEDNEYYKADVFDSDDPPGLADNPSSSKKSNQNLGPTQEAIRALDDALFDDVDDPPTL